MPYLTAQNQKRLNDIICQVVMTDFLSPGDLNYLFCKIALAYLHGKGESYQTYNDIVGALECAKTELYLRKVTPYEETKAELNGDIFNG